MPYTGKKTIAVDFDGVIHKYSAGWQGGVIYDPPVENAMSGLGALAPHFRLVVFTARESLDPVVDWLKKHNLDRYIDEVTNEKPVAMLYIDDRGLRFTTWDDAIQHITAMLEEGTL